MVGRWRCEDDDKRCRVGDSTLVLKKKFENPRRFNRQGGVTPSPQAFLWETASSFLLKKKKIHGTVKVVFAFHRFRWCRQKCTSHLSWNLKWPPSIIWDLCACSLEERAEVIRSADGSFVEAAFPLSRASAQWGTADAETNIPLFVEKPELKGSLTL